jgi:hypothetical protein
MPKKPKPHAERKPEDYMEAAENALEMAKVLAGEGGISDQDFLQRMARSDELVDHDGKTCGQCHYQILGAEVARELIEAGTPPQQQGREECPCLQICLVASAASRTVSVTAISKFPAAATVCLSSAFVNGERTPVDFLAVQGGNGCLGLLTTSHLDEAETFRPARVPVHDDLGRLNRSVRVKQVLQIAVGHAIRQVADVQRFSHNGPPSENITQDKLGPQRANAVAQ